MALLFGAFDWARRIRLKKITTWQFQCSQWLIRTIQGQVGRVAMLPTTRHIYVATRLCEVLITLHYVEPAVVRLYELA
jgi:hypothetical protein